MEFFISKNATLPVLKLQVVKDGRSDYSKFMSMIEVSSVFFSMVNTETGVPKISSKTAGFVEKTFLDPNAETEYYLYYQFTNRDTNRVGRYEAEFLLRNPDGVLIVPMREKLYVNVVESFIADDLGYSTGYTSNFPCCNNGTLVSAATNPDYTLFGPELLGRQYVEDNRDSNFPIEGLLEAAVKINPLPKITSRYWDDNGWWGDQGKTPQCVGFAWAHWLEDGPIPQSGVAPIISPKIIYEGAQRLDEWPGENYNGTSVRGGVKFLQQQGKISNYFWTTNIDTLIDTILMLGPVVVGTNWYTNMFYPNSLGIISATGRIAGGHAYVVNGVDTTKKLFKIKNSWGRRWGKMGSAYISFNDMSKLLREYGEVCIATEIGS